MITSSFEIFLIVRLIGYPKHRFGLSIHLTHFRIVICIFSGVEVIAEVSKGILDVGVMNYLATVVSIEIAALLMLLVGSIVFVHLSWWIFLVLECRRWRSRIVVVINIIVVVIEVFVLLLWGSVVVSILGLRIQIFLIIFIILLSFRKLFYRCFIDMRNRLNIDILFSPRLIHLTFLLIPKKVF